MLTEIEDFRRSESVGEEVVARYCDTNTTMVERVRAVIGRDTALVVALDYHANIDETWLNVATAIFGYHYSPHTDQSETDERAARCLITTVKGEMKPVMAIAKPGVMVSSIFSATGMAPLSGIVAESVTMPATVDKLVDVSVLVGFSYADVPNCGFAVAAVANDCREVAENAAKHVSKRIWTERQALVHGDLVLSLQDGLDRAVARARETAKPVVILGHADRENDPTYVLHEVIRRKMKRVAVPYLCDPEAVVSAARAGTGAEVTLEAGGRSSDRAGGPVTLKGRVLFAGEKIYRGTGAVRKANLINLGQSAIIDADGVVVIITSHKNTAVDLDPFVQFGLKFEDFVVLRSKTHFCAACEPLAREIIIVDTLDWGPADLSTLPYRHVPVDRIFPFCGGDPRIWRSLPAQHCVPNFVLNGTMRHRYAPLASLRHPNRLQDLGRGRGCTFLGKGAWSCRRPQSLGESRQLSNVGNPAGRGGCTDSARRAREPRPLGYRDR